MENKKNAIKNVAKAAAFILILLLMLRSISYVMRTNGDSKDRFAGFYSEKRNSIDVMYFGASTVGSSFIPAYIWGNYGFTSYPLSSNSQRTVAYKYLIDEALKYQDPSLVVVEMRTFVGDNDEMALDEGHVRETVDNMKYSWNRIKTINAVADHFDDKENYYFDIMKYHSNMGMLLQKNEWKKFNYSTPDPLKGYVVRNVVESYRHKKQPVFDEEAKVAIDVAQEEILKDLLEYLKANDLKALFVVTPRDNENDYLAKMNYAGDIVRAYGFDYLDMNYYYQEMGFDFSKDMNDGAHTNIWGAVKCSDLLGSYIKDNYNIRTEYDSDTVNKWNGAYSYFNDLYNSTEPEESIYTEGDW